MCRSGWSRAGATDGSASRVRSTEDVFPLASPASDPALAAPCRYRTARGGSGGEPNRIRFPSGSTCAPSFNP